jgi:hypothetical protein
MRRSSGRDGHARSPALERCEDRVLQSVAIEPAIDRSNDIKLTTTQETASSPDGTQLRVLYEARIDLGGGNDAVFFFSNGF